MTTLVAGASGATGKCLVDQLLKMDQNVKVMVRPTGKIPDTWNDNPRVSVIRAEISTITPGEMAGFLKDCQAVASCLGHNITLKGIFGRPRKLVSGAVRLICMAIEMNSPETPFKVVLMNTTANRNKDLNEPVTTGQRIVIGLTRLLLPPQRDNELAADFLRVAVGRENRLIEWVVVRPDTLIDQDEVSEFELYRSPEKDPVFSPGKTSRINVAHFMARLIVGTGLWNTWKGSMPVIYNRTDG